MKCRRENFKKFYEKFLIRFIFFLKNANISGIRFLTERCGILGKIFWIIALTITFVGMLIIFNLTAQRFFSDYVSIGIDTGFLNWNNTFPSLSICLVKGRSSNPISKFILDANLTFDRKKSTPFLRNIHYYMFSNPNQMFLTSEGCEQLNSTCGVDVEVLIDKFLPKTCNEIIKNVYFAGKYYNNCSELFKYHKTEMGTCFIVNSISDYDYDIEKVPLKFNRASNDFTFRFYQKLNRFFYYQFYVHSPEDFPYFNLIPFTLTIEPIKFSLNIEEIINADGVEEQPVDYRGCRFPNEKLPNSSMHYSFSTCMSNLRVEVELQTCNCTLFTSLEKYREHYCELKGLMCLHQGSIHNKTKDLNTNPEKRCLPSCNEQRIAIIGENEDLNKDVPGYTMTEVKVINLPSVRYVRQVAKTPLDLVVAIGGVAGLFFGASVINIVEVIYIFMIRKVY